MTGLGGEREREREGLDKSKAPNRRELDDFFLVFCIFYHEIIFNN
jgi:hypothetical protein